MSPQQILKEAADLSQEDLLNLQCGIAELMASRFSPYEIAEINQSLDTADAEFKRGQGLSGVEVRKQLGLSDRLLFTNCPSRPRRSSHLYLNGIEKPTSGGSLPVAASGCQ